VEAHQLLLKRVAQVMVVIEVLVAELQTQVAVAVAHVIVVQDLQVVTVGLV
jgi:hypothetical protein